MSEKEFNKESFNQIEKFFNENKSRVCICIGIGENGLSIIHNPGLSKVQAIDILEKSILSLKVDGFMNNESKTFLKN